MTKTATIYGIKNCETMNKARAWLEKANVINTLPVDQFLAALRPKPGTVRKKHPTPKARASN